MENRTFIRDFRDDEEHPLYTNPNAWHLWRYYCKKARRTKHIISWAGEKMEIDVCEIKISRKKVSLDTGLTEQNIRTSNRLLETFKMIKKIHEKSKSKFTVYRLIKDDIRDILNLDEGNQQVTSSQPASNQQPTHNNKYNKIIINNKQKKIKTKNLYSVLPGEKTIKFKTMPIEAIKLGTLLSSYIRKNNPEYTTIRNNTEFLRNAWSNAGEIDMLNRIDKVSWGKIEKVIHWCQNDKKNGRGNDWKGWWNVILSGKKLRTKYGTMVSRMGPNENPTISDYGWERRG